MTEYKKFKQELNEFEKKMRYAGSVPIGGPRPFMREKITGQPVWKTMKNGVIVKSPPGKFRKTIYSEGTETEVERKPYQKEAIILDFFWGEDGKRLLSVGEIDEGLSFVEVSYPSATISTHQAYDGFALIEESSNSYTLRDFVTWDTLATYTSNLAYLRPPVWLYHRATQRGKFIEGRRLSDDENRDILINGVACGITASMVAYANKKLLCFELKAPVTGETYPSLYRVIEATTSGNLIKTVTINSDIRQPASMAYGWNSEPQFYHDPESRSYHLYGLTGVLQPPNWRSFLWETYNYSWVRTKYRYVPDVGVYGWPMAWVRNEYGEYDVPGGYFYALAPKAVFFKNDKMYVPKYNYTTIPNYGDPAEVPYQMLGYVDWGSYIDTHAVEIAYSVPLLTFPDTFYHDGSGGWIGWNSWTQVTYKNLDDTNNYLQYRGA